MKSMEVHKMKTEELGVELARLRNDLFDLRSQGVTEKVEDTSRFPKIRKDIARLLTEQTARLRAGGEAGNGKQSAAGEAPKAKPAAKAKAVTTKAPAAKKPTAKKPAAATAEKKTAKAPAAKSGGTKKTTAKKA